MEAMGQQRANETTIKPIINLLTIAFISFLPLNYLLISFVFINLQKGCQGKEKRKKYIITMGYEVEAILNSLAKSQKMAKWPSIIC
jgi:hypothetical protein